MRTLEASQDAERQATGNSVIWLLEIELPQSGTKRYATRDVTVGSDAYLPLLAEIGDAARVLPSDVTDSAVYPADETWVRLLNFPEDTTNQPEQFLETDVFEGSVARLYMIFETGSALANNERIQVHTYQIEDVQLDGRFLRLRLSDFSLGALDRRIGYVVNRQDWPKAEAASVGKVIPHIFGTVRDCPLIPVDVGSRGVTDGTTEADQDYIAFRELNVSDPLSPVYFKPTAANPITVQIDAEQIICNDFNASLKRLIVQAGGRGANSTTPTRHGDGSTVQEIRSAGFDFAVAAHNCKAINAVRDAVGRAVTHTTHKVTKGDQPVQIVRLSSIPSWSESSQSLQTMLLDKADQWSIHANNSAGNNATWALLSNTHRGATVSKNYPNFHLQGTRIYSEAAYGEAVKATLCVEYDGSPGQRTSLVLPTEAIWHDGQFNVDLKLDGVSLLTDGDRRYLPSPLGAICRASQFSGHQHPAHLSTPSTALFERETASRDMQPINVADWTQWGLAPSLLNIGVYEEFDPDTGDLILNHGTWYRGQQAHEDWHQHYIYDGQDIVGSHVYSGVWIIGCAGNPEYVDIIQLVPPINVDDTAWFGEIYPIRSVFEEQYASDNRLINRVWIRAHVWVPPWNYTDALCELGLLNWATGAIVTWPAYRITPKIPGATSGFGICDFWADAPFLYNELLLGTPTAGVREFDLQYLVVKFNAPNARVDYSAYLGYFLPGTGFNHVLLCGIQAFVEYAEDLRGYTQGTDPVVESPSPDEIPDLWLRSTRSTQRIDCTDLFETHGWDLLGTDSEVRIWADSAATNLSDVRVYRIYWEIEYRPTEQKAGFEGLIADVDGYQTAGGKLIENPADVIACLLTDEDHEETAVTDADFGGLHPSRVGASYIDLTTFTAAFNEYQAVGWRLGRRIDTVESIRDLVASAAGESMARLYFEGDTYRLQMLADVMDAVTSGAPTINETYTLEEVQRQLTPSELVANRILLGYRLDYTNGSKPIHVVQRDDDASQAEAWGVRAREFRLLWHQRSHGFIVERLAQFYLSRLSKKRTLIRVRTPLYMCHLERGDVVPVTSTRNNLDAIAAQVIGIRFPSLSEMEFALLAETVPTEWWESGVCRIVIAGGDNALLFYYDNVLVAQWTWDARLFIRGHVVEKSTVNRTSRTDLIECDATEGGLRVNIEFAASPPPNDYYSAMLFKSDGNLELYGPTIIQEDPGWPLNPGDPRDIDHIVSYNDGHSYTIFMLRNKKIGQYDVLNPVGAGQTGTFGLKEIIENAFS